MLPAILCSQDPYADLLDYVGLYLKEEIKFEGLVRELNIFSEFLRLAALSNTEQIVYANFAHDAQISVPTAKEYFQILEDTLIGYQLPPFSHTKKRKAMSSAKFYFFDCGVVNAILQRKEMIAGTVEYGKQFEQLIFQELRAYLQLNRHEHRLEYWRSQKKDEVDFILYDSLKNMVAIEVKSSKRPRSSDVQGLLRLEEEFPLKRKIVVCNTDHSYLDHDIEYLSVLDFLEQLWENKIIVQE
jgi:predicted AAA+ superfamily ATPase